MLGLLIVVAPLVAEHGLSGTQLWVAAAGGSVVAAPSLQSTGSMVGAHGFSSSPHLPGPGIQSASPAFGRWSFTTEPPGKPCFQLFKVRNK